MTKDLRLIISVIIYVFCLNYAYINYLIPTWGYMGYFENNIISIPLSIYKYFLIIFPSLFISKTTTRISQFFFIMLYLIIYIPTIIILTRSWIGDLSNYFQFTLSYFFAFIIMLFFTRIKLMKISLFKIKISRVIKFIFLVSIFLLLYIILTRYDSLEIVDFTNSEEVYSLREGKVEASSFDGYIILILSSMILPILLSYSIYRKRYLYMTVGFLGFLILFSIGANKSYLFVPFFILIGYYIATIEPKKINFRIVSFFSILTVVLTFLIVNGNEMIQLIFFFPAAFFIFRTIFTSGWQSLVYYDFFNISSNDLTYLSQTKFFNIFSEYPYFDLLGKTLGYYVFKDPNLSLNANFLISDGLASFWFMGIIIISILYSVIFYILDCTTFKFPLPFVVGCTFFSIISISNTSIFTTLLSGGLFLIFLVFLITNNNHEKNQ